jgi:hypothetical protein
MLCPPGVFSQPLLEKLRKSEGLDLKISSPDTPKEYFRKLYQDLQKFDLVCIGSHHITENSLKEQFALLPITAEWRDRRLHTDFRTVPVDPKLERFWPLGWRVYLPTISAEKSGAWATTSNRFGIYLMEDFREVLHFYLGKNLIREEWLNPEFADHLSSILSKEQPTYNFVSEKELLDKITTATTASAVSPVDVLYVPHTLWYGLPEDVRKDWIWGLREVPGNLEVLGLAAPTGTSAELVETLLRVISHPAIGSQLSESSRWASTLQGATTQDTLHPTFLRNIPLTHFQWISGLEPSGLFWERIVASAKDPSNRESTPPSVDH